MSGAVDQEDIPTETVEKVDDLNENDISPETQEDTEIPTDSVVNDTNDSRLVGVEGHGNEGISETVSEEVSTEPCSEHGDNIVQVAVASGLVEKKDEAPAVAELEDDHKNAVASSEQIEQQLSSSSDVKNDAMDLEADTLPQEASLREQEETALGAEIVFPRAATKNHHGWDNLRWMSYAGARKVLFCDSVSQFCVGRRTLFWSGDHYELRKLAVYEDPMLILLLRPPSDSTELREILDIDEGAPIENEKQMYKSFLVVESVVEPKTCKLRFSQLTTPTSIDPEQLDVDLRKQSCFAVITPTESLILSSIQDQENENKGMQRFRDAKAFLETKKVEHVLETFICNAHRPPDDSNGQQDLSWKHQVILGTLHSLVLHGNPRQLDLGIQSARGRQPDKGPFLDERVVNAIDDSGRTPLHYACTTRFSAATKSLIEAGCSLDLRAGLFDMTPCHLAALALDDRALSSILQANRRPEVVDKLGRTPMYLAATEGAAVGGGTDIASLDHCLNVLKSSGAGLGVSGGLLHPVSLLASKWKHEQLATVLEYVNYRYPTSRHTRPDMIGSSISSLCHYPVHMALCSLTQRVRAARAGETIACSNELVGTLCVLLEHGFESNERIEIVADSIQVLKSLKGYIGFSPLQILCVAALDLVQGKDGIDGATFMMLRQEITRAAELLVRSGARLSMDVPPEQRRSCTPPSSNPVSPGNCNATEVHSVDRSKLKIQTNKELLKILGDEKLSDIEAEWLSQEATSAPGSFVFFTDKQPIEDSKAPGGSDEASCATCWSTFGTLMNRKHRCRVSRRYICDACSTKRLIDRKGEEHRVSDGVYQTAQYLKNKPKRTSVPRKIDSKSPRKDKTQEDNVNRESLFGGVISSVTKKVLMGDPDAQNETQNDTVAGLSHQLSQTRDVLNQRGEKLNTLADKSDRLVSASQDFASMAKELNKQTGSGFFW